jgi:uncharacterized protein YciI
MLFIVQFEELYADQPERLPTRAEHMAGHLAFLAEHGNQVVASGALRPSANGVPTGGIWIVNAGSKAVVEALCKDDPFWKAGLRKSVQVSHWAKAHWSPAFTDCVAALG